MRRKKEESIPAYKLSPEERMRWVEIHANGYPYEAFIKKEEKLPYHINLNGLSDRKVFTGKVVMEGYHG